jgi:hypothetical protein
MLIQHSSLHHIVEQGIIYMNKEEPIQKPRNYKGLFNLQHVQLRNNIERAIGILKKRFS